VSHHYNNGHSLRLLAATLTLVFVCTSVAAQNGNSSTLRFVDQETGTPLSGVIVMSETAGDSKEGPGEYRMVQKNRAFDPHVLVVRQGAEVNFPNEDNTQHHVYSFSKPKPFNIELYSGQPEAPIVFDRPGIVELGCNIHDQMQAFVVVSESARTRQSDAEGRVPLDDAFTRLTELQVWHPRLEDNSQPIRISLEDGSRNEQVVRLPVNPEPETDGRLDALQKRFQDL